MNIMLQKIQGQDAIKITIRDYVAVLERTAVAGFIVATIGILLGCIFPKQIFADGVIYPPSLLAAVIGQICFVTAYWCLQNRRHSSIPEGSTFFTFLGLGFFILAVMTCLLHSVAVDQFLAYHLELLRTR